MTHYVYCGHHSKCQILILKWVLITCPESMLTYCSLENLDKLFKMQFSTLFYWLVSLYPLQWRHSECNGVSNSNNQPRECLLKRWFGRRSRKTSKLHVTCLCEGNSPVASEFPAQRASNAENISIGWRHYVFAIIPSGCQGTLVMPSKHWLTLF